MIVDARTAYKAHLMLPTDEVEVSLRIYTSGGGDEKCPGNETWGHDASVLMGTFPANWREDEADGIKILKEFDPPAEWKTLYPNKCDACAHLFTPNVPKKCSCGCARTRTDQGPTYKQVFQELLWVDPDGNKMTQKNFAAGAMYYSFWRSKGGWMTGPDGKSLNIRLPNGSDWCIDARANNCTRPDDNKHRCWCRHHTLIDLSDINVDKVGDTCLAGAGSIVMGDYHGFLREGYLIPA